MGAGASTEGAHLTRVTSKNNLGVLFDREAEEAFHAAATGPEDELAVPWSVADAYVKTRDERWRDPKHVLFQGERLDAAVYRLRKRPGRCAAAAARQMRGGRSGG